MNNCTRRRRNSFKVPGNIGSSHFRKPHLDNRYVWKPAIPLWEKKFCNEIGNMSWGRFLEAKRYINIYPNVLNWRDSAVEEAFHNAKKRFWANINELSCDVLSLPDPDIHNDVIDWNNDDIDPELILDLDREFVVQDDQEGGVIIGLPDPYAGYSTGWGDLDDIPNVKTDVVKPLPPTTGNEPIHSTGWGEGSNEAIPGLDESYKHIVATGCGDDNYVTGDGQINSSREMWMYNFLRFNANNQN